MSTNFFIYRWLRSRLSLQTIETAWDNAQNSSMASTNNTISKSTTQTRSNWPFIIFLSALIGAPYLTWKMLSSEQDTEKEEETPVRAPWIDGNYVFLA